MSSAPKTDPMDDLPAAVAAFEEDVARIDIFVNGTETEDYTTEDARLVPSLSKVVANVNAMIAPDLVAINQAVTTATTAASNAAASASSAHTDATTADNAADLAEGYSTSASASASNATDSAVRAEAAATASGNARDAAAASQVAAKTSETNSAANASAAGLSKDAANVSATAAANSATNAGTAATPATTTASAADVSAQAAAASQVAAKTSETNSGASAAAAHVSELNAAASAASVDTSNFVSVDGSRAMTGALQTTGLAIQGAARRIVGDYSANTHTARVMFQTSTANANTLVGAMPNGTGTVSAFNALSASDPDNSNMAQLASYQGEMRLTASALGTASFQPMTFYTGGLERFRLPPSVPRFVADFSNAAQGSRFLFQTSAANSGTSVGAIPTATTLTNGSNFIAYAQPDASNSAYLQMSCYGSTAIFNASATGSGSQPALYFNTAGQIRYSIDPSGNHYFSGNYFTITSPFLVKGTTTLDTNAGNSALSYGLFFRAGTYSPQIRSTTSYAPGAMEWVNGANTAVIMRLIDTGGLMLGVSVGNYTKLNVNNFGPNYGAGAMFQPNVDGAWPLGFLSVGGADAGHIGITGTTTAYGTTSDYRLKTNVEDLEGSLERVMECRPVSFDWISDGKSARGFIAHELQPIEPDAVMGEKDGTRRNAEKQEEPEYQCVDLSFLVPDLVGAIQALKAEVDELRAELAVLIDPLKRAQ
jgi:hypothetical protein